MASMMKFQHDVVHDVVFVVVDCNLETEADVNAWYEEYAVYFRSRFKTRKDVIIDLSRFHVHARIGSYFGKMRAKMLADFTNRSYRIHFNDKKTKMFAHTSSALYGAPINEFPDAETALRKLLSDRRADARLSDNKG